jgi:hypothetical protein
MSKQVSFLALGLAVTAISVITLSNAASSTAPERVPVLGYTVISHDDGSCDLNSIDLATGQLTDLPAPSAISACSTDLAVAPNGTVYGLDGDHPYRLTSLDPYVDSDGNPHLITYDRDGYPTITTLTNNDNVLTGLLDGGIAVSADGTIWTQIQDATVCDSPLDPATGLYISDSVPLVCLFTINPLTGVATLVGPASPYALGFVGLTSCSSAMHTLAFELFTPGSLSNQPASLLLNWGLIDTASGAVIFVPVQSPPSGYDCLPTGDTVYALDWHSGSNQLGTIDLTTGDFTATVALSDPDADISYVAFAVAPPAEPATTTTLTPPDPSIPTFAG